MSKIKIMTGIGLVLQAFTFFVMLIMVSSDKKKRAIALALLAAGTGIAGVYLVLKESKNYIPETKCCCCEGEEEEEFELENLAEDIDCTFSDDDII